MNFSIVVATDNNRGIGLKGTLPWNLKADLKYFKKLTTTTKDPNKQNAVIMGRTTWLSIPEKFRPLPDRINIVLSTSVTKIPHALVASSLFEACLLAENSQVENLFVIGGGKVYQEAIELPNCTKLFITEIHQSFSCDTYFPSYRNKYTLTSSSEKMEENDYSFHFNVYEKDISSM